ncbi:jg8365, partial [Pararge aegeria aegeria]
EPLTTQHRILVACLNLPNWNKNPKIKSLPRIKWYNLNKTEGLAAIKQVKEYLADPIDNFETIDANTLWNDFHTHAIAIGKKVLGVTKGSKLNTGKDASWWSRDVKEKLIQKKTSFKKWQNTNSELDKTEYIIAKRTVKQPVATADEELISRLQSAKTENEIFKNSETP